MIVSVEKAREVIQTDLSDAQLEMKLTALELFIRNYTHNDFQIREIRSSSGIFDNIIENPPLNITVGDTVQISQSLLNNGVYSVTGITDDGMRVSGTLYDCVSNLVTKVYYPPDIEEGVVNMLKWQIENAGKAGVQSEKLSRYSVTYFNSDENSSFGFPKTVIAFLKPYMKARF